MKTGRPKTPKDKARSFCIRVRVTAAERKEIDRRKKAAKSKSESAWIRERLLGEE